MPSPDRRSPGPQTLRVLAGRRPRILLLEINCVGRRFLYALNRAQPHAMRDFALRRAGAASCFVVNAGGRVVLSTCKGGLRELTAARTQATDRIGSPVRGRSCAASAFAAPCWRRSP